jgi:4'-phosphopantetheinyl transferase
MLPLIRKPSDQYQRSLLVMTEDAPTLHSVGPININVHDGWNGFDIPRIERVRSDFEYEEIAERFFSVNEAAILRTIPTEKKLEAFYNCWTRKEAYLKAHGKGLSLPLGSFDVSFAPWEPPMLLITKDEPQERSLWTLLDLMPSLGYMGALAVKGTGCRFRYWEWNQL